MRTRQSRFTLAALTAATLAPPLAVTGCANMGVKCAGQCKPKCGTKSGAKCGPS